MNFMRMIQLRGSWSQFSQTYAFAQDLWDLELKSEWLCLGKGLSFTSKNICIEQQEAVKEDNIIKKYAK